MAQEELEGSLWTLPSGVERGEEGGRAKPDLEKCSKCKMCGLSFALQAGAALVRAFLSPSMSSLL